MAPKRNMRGKQPVGQSSRSRARTNDAPTPPINAHGIIFTNPAHEVRYSRHVRRKITPSRYMCSETLSALGLSDEINRMFHVLGILEFMHCEALTYERITLEFLSSVNFQLQSVMEDEYHCHSGTMTFRLYNEDHTLTVEELGAVLHLPIYGRGAIPSYFSPSTFWNSITKEGGYVAKSAKASKIQNPCFRYAQKCLAFSLFGRGDSTGMASRAEL